MATAPLDPVTPINIATVRKLLANTTDASVVRKLVTSDATYVSLNFENANLHKIMPWCGTHTASGPQGIIETFENVDRHWENKDFTIQGIFGDEANVAVFGSFTYMARVTQKTVTSPFAIWCRFDWEGKINFMQFMEDTFMTASSFEVSGVKTYHADPDGREVRM